MLKRLETFLNKPSVSLIFHAFEKFGHVVAVASVIVAALFYVTEADERRRSNELQAWQLVLLLEGKQAGGARVDALEYLASNDVSLAGAPLAKARLVGAHLEGAKFYETNLEGADLSDAHLSGADLEAAILNRAVLVRTELIDAKLNEAKLNDAKLSHAKLHQAKLHGAELKNAILSHAQLPEAELPFAELPSARLNQANLYKAWLASANLEGAILTYTNLIEADLGLELPVNVILKNLGLDTNSRSLYMHRTDRSTTLKDAFLWGADLRGADLTEAILDGARMSDTDLRGVRNLTCEQLKTSTGWEYAYRDPELSCGAEIPSPPPCRIPKPAICIPLLDKVVEALLTP